MNLRLFVSFLFALLAMGFVPGTRMVARARLFPIARATDSRVPGDFEEHVWRARDGVAVHAFELAAPPGARTIVAFHNNSETAVARADLARALRKHGLGVVLVEYRGYGISQGGVPSEEGLYLDAECVLDMLKARGVGPEHIVLWGTSLGTGVAAEMARRGRGAGLVLVTPYTSIPGLVADVAPLVPAHLLVPDHFDTLAKAPGIRVPTLVIHGDEDEVVPFWMGRRVARAIPGARFLRVPGARHDVCRSAAERVLDGIVEIAGAAEPRAMRRAG